MMKTLFVLISMVLFATDAIAQGLTQHFWRQLTDPNGYVVYRTKTPIVIDGVPDEAAWQNAPIIDKFQDISGEGFPLPL